MTPASIQLFRTPTPSSDAPSTARKCQTRLPKGTRAIAPVTGWRAAKRRIIVDRITAPANSNGRG